MYSPNNYTNVGLSYGYFRRIIQLSWVLCPSYYVAYATGGRAMEVLVYPLSTVFFLV